MTINKGSLRDQTIKTIGFNHLTQDKIYNLLKRDDEFLRKENVKNIIGKLSRQGLLSFEISNNRYLAKLTYKGQQVYIVIRDKIISQS